MDTNNNPTIKGSDVHKEIYNVLNHLSTRIGDKLTEYHWREFCGLMKMMEDEKLIEVIWDQSTQLDQTTHQPNQERSLIYKDHKLIFNDNSFNSGSFINDDSFFDDELIISLESAKFLKNEGYNKPSHYYYMDGDIPFVKKGLKRVKMDARRMNHNNYDEFIYSAPTQEECIKWIKQQSKKR